MRVRSGAGRARALIVVAAAALAGCSSGGSVLGQSTGPDPFRLVQLGPPQTGTASAWQLRASSPTEGGMLDVAAVDGLVVNGWPGPPSTVTARDLRTGAVHWRVSHAASLTDMWVAGDSRTLVLLYTARDDASVAVGLDPRTGQQRWQRALPGTERTDYLPAWQTPGAGDGEICGAEVNSDFGTQHYFQYSAIEGLDPATGSTVWRADPSPDTLQSIGTSATATAVMELNRNASRGAVSVYDASGRRRWTHPAGFRLLGDVFNLVDAVNTTAVLVQWWYVPRDAPNHENGIMQALDPATGTVRWARPLAGTKMDAPVMAADATHIVVQSAAGTRVDLLDTASGDRQSSWRLHATAAALTSSHAYLYTPATTSTAAAIHIIDLGTGRRTDQALPATSTVSSYPRVTVANGRIILASGDNHARTVSVTSVGTP